VNTWMLTYCEVCLNCQTFLEVTKICKYVAVFFNLILFKCVVEQLITFENNILLEKLTLV